jgi:multiple sugar transport system ATP-binding protein
MPDVQFENVCKLFPGGICAVADFGLHVRHGELLVLVGPSGCGKTTTLRLVAGLETPTAGLVRIGNRVMNGVPPAARDVALVFQRPVLDSLRTVQGNLTFGLALRHRDSWWRRLLSSQKRRQHDEVQEHVKATAEMLGLTPELRRYPADLSGGQQQRVALGRALVRRPGVLLLDEPLSNLDTGLRQELRRQLHLIQRQLQVTMLYVTHDPMEAITLGDRLAVMDRGRLQQVGSPTEVFQQPLNRFVAAFVGWPPMNFIDGQLQVQAGQMVFVACSGQLAVPAAAAERWADWVGRPLILGIRPENVQICPPSALAAWPMQVRLIEALGHSTLITLASRSTEITAWCRGGCHFPEPMDTMEAEKTVMVRISLENGHLFDRVSGAALRVRATG